MSGWRTGFPVTPRSSLRIAFGGGGAGAMRLPATTTELVFRGGGGGSLSTKSAIAFRGGGQGRLQQKALISFMGGGAGSFGVAPPVYATGYAHYLEFLIPAASVIDGPHTNFPLLIDETFPELRSVANGGLVQHASGFDMLLTLGDDTPIDFARQTWSAVTGRIVIRSRVPTLPAADTRVRLYFGKFVVADGANQGGAYAAYLLALDCRLGTDLTGQGRTFTPSFVGPEELIGDCGDYNSLTSRMQIASFAAANGLSAFTVEAVIAPQASADGCIMSSGPTSAAGDANLGLTFGYNDPGLVGGAASTIAFKVETSAGASRVEAPANTQAGVGVPQFLAGVWASGTAAKLFVDEAFVTASNTPIARTGTTLVERGGPTSVGWSPVTPTGAASFWAGSIDELCISARALSEGFLQTQAANYLSPRDFYGVGEVNSASAVNLSPILPPIFATATVGSPSTVDAALVAYEADTGQVKTLESLTGSGGGTSAIVGGRAQFTSSAVGEARRIATVKDDASPPKRTLAPIIWMASASVSAGEEYPARTGALFTINSQADWDAAKAVADPGDHLVIANGLAINPGTWSVSGTLAEPIVIRAATNQSPRFSGGMSLAASHVQVWGMPFGTNTCTIGTSLSQVGLRLRRCSWANRVGTNGITCNITTGGALIEYCQMINFTFVRGFWGNNSTNVTIRRCLFKDWLGTGAQTREPITIGEGANTHTVDSGWLIEYCLFTNLNQNNAENEAISAKSSNNIIQYCCFNNARNMNQRFGNGNRYYACRITGFGDIEVHGKDHVYNSVWCDRSINLVKGNFDSSLPGKPTDTHPNALNVKLIGCHMPVTIGASPSGTFNAIGTQFEGHVGSITDTQGGHLYTQTSVLSEAIITPPFLTEADVGVDAGL